MKLRKTDSSGTEQWYKMLNTTSIGIWSTGTLSADGSMIAINGNGGMSLDTLIFDTSDGTAKKFTDMQVNYPQIGAGATFIFSPSGDFLFRTASDGSGSMTLGYICRLNITGEQYICKDLVNGASDGGAVVGFEVLDDNRVIVQWIWDQGSGLKFVFGLFNFSSNTFTWIKEAD